MDDRWRYWGLALCAIAGGHFERGVTLYAAAERLNTTVGVPASPAARAFLERARTHLSEHTMAAAWRRGSAMRIDEAVGAALHRSPPEARASTGTASSIKLSGRERQVLALLASGRSNQDIADELVLSVRTVENHVARIYQKLDVRSRVQATVYALRHGLSADQGVE